MRFDLSGETQGVWFKYFESEVGENGDPKPLEPDKDETLEVCIRAMNADVMKGIKAKTSKTVEKFILNTKSKAMERIQYEDQTPEQREEESNAVWDYVIEDWRGAFDKSGNEVPCTSENKKLIMKNNLQFVWFAARCLHLVTRTNVDKVEGAEKNS
jgi:hypothetical protein